MLGKHKFKPSPAKAQSEVERVEEIIREVVELPDRTSPDDWPDAMLVTADELRSILSAIPSEVQIRAEERERTAKKIESSSFSAASEIATFIRTLRDKP